MAGQFLGALIYDSGINLDGLRRDSEAAKKRLVDIGETAKKTFQNDIARGLAKAVRPEHFAADVAKAKAILGSIGPDTSKILERELGRNLARKTLQPFLDESRTLGAQIKSSLSSSFSIKNIAGGFLAADLVSSTLRGLFDIGAATVNIARDAAETRNKFNVIFGDLSDEVRAFANSYADSVGRARIDTEDFLSTISGIFTTVGFAGREAANFSKEITKLTFDLASFFNTTDNEALTALRAGLIGESEPLRRFNVFLSEARLETEALAFGIKKTGKEFSDQEKTFLRYQIIMKDTALAQGDALRTAESFANQQKAFSANLKNLGESVGNVVLPPLNSLISVVNDIIKSFEDTTEIEEAEKRLIKFGIAADEISFRRMIDKSIELSDKARQLREDYTLLAKDTKVLGEVVRSIFPDRALDVIASEKEAQKVIEFTKLAGFRLQIEQKITESKRKAAEFELAIATAGEDERKRLSANLRIELDRIENLQKVITAQDEIARAEKEAVEARERAAEAQKRIEAGAEAVSDNVQTLSSSAENTADNFERSAKALEAMANNSAKIKSTPVVDELFKDRNTALKQQLKTILEAQIKLIPESSSEKKRKNIEELNKIEDEFEQQRRERQRRVQQDLVNLFDVFDRGVGDVAASLFNFIDMLRDKEATSIGKLAGGLNLFQTFLSTGIPLLQNLFGSLFSDGNERSKIASALQAEEDKRIAAERTQAATDELRNAFERLSDTLLTQSIQELEKNFISTDEAIRNLIGTTKALTKEDLQRSVDLVDFINELKLKLAEAERRGDFDLAEELRAQIQGAENELARLGLDIRKLTAAQIEQLRILFDQKDAIQRQLDLFGKFADNFSGLMEELNFKFQVLNIDDAGQKLDALQKDIKKRFGAIIPTTQSGIRDLIAQGLAALDAGGDTLVRFLKSLDLEEFAPDDLREFLLLLNGLANDLNKQLGEASDAASESVISQVRLATFEQTNALIDNTVTMRIVLTNILDAERQMLELARRNIGLTGNGSAITGTHDRFFFFNDGVISETTAANLSQLQRRMYNDAAAQAGGKGLS